MIFNKKSGLFVLFLICLTELFFIGYLTKENAFIKRKFEKQKKELNDLLLRNEIYDIYNSRLDFYASIPLKITDGKHKFLIIVNLGYLKEKLIQKHLKSMFLIF